MVRKLCNAMTTNENEIANLLLNNGNVHLIEKLRDKKQKKEKQKRVENESCKEQDKKRLTVKTKNFAIKSVILWMI